MLSALRTVPGGEKITQVCIRLYPVILRVIDNAVFHHYHGCLDY